MGEAEAMEAIRVGVLTVSDRCASGERVDQGGPAVAEAAVSLLQAVVVASACVSDDRGLITQTLKAWAERPHPEREGRADVDLVLTTGGTGLAPRDHTPEATLDLIERRHSGLMELIRMRCFAITPKAYLSRGEAGTYRRTLVINLPGSPRGAVESLEALADILPHAVETLRGDVKDG